MILLINGRQEVADFDELGVVLAKALFFHAMELLVPLSAVLGFMDERTTSSQERRNGK